MSRAFESCSVCRKPATQRCPTCDELKLPTVHFCGKPCFKRAWKEHKLTHTVVQAGSSPIDTALRTVCREHLQISQQLQASGLRKAVKLGIFVRKQVLKCLALLQDAKAVLPLVSNSTTTPTSALPQDMPQAPEHLQANDLETAVKQIVKPVASTPDASGIVEAVRVCVKNVLDLTFEDECKLERTDFSDSAKAQQVLDTLRNIPTNFVADFYQVNHPETENNETAINTTITSSPGSEPAENSQCDDTSIVSTQEVWCDSKGPISVLPSEEQFVALLGVELAEVWLFRTGNLIYMLVHTTISATSEGSPAMRRTLDAALVEQGIADFNRMFEIRGVGARLQGLEGPESTEVETRGEGGEEVALLLEQKIYSSQHLLVLMYSAEMCYWRSLLPAETTVDWKAEAIWRLYKFQQVVQSVSTLKQSWNTQRAEEILKILDPHQEGRPAALMTVVQHKASVPSAYMSITE